MRVGSENVHVGSAKLASDVAASNAVVRSTVAIGHIRPPTRDRKLQVVLEQSLHSTISNTARVRCQRLYQHLQTPLRHIQLWLRQCVGLAMHCLLLGGLIAIFMVQAVGHLLERRQDGKGSSCPQFARETAVVAVVATATAASSGADIKGVFVVAVALNVCCSDMTWQVYMRGEYTLSRAHSLGLKLPPAVSLQIATTQVYAREELRLSDSALLSCAFTFRRRQKRTKATRIKPERTGEKLAARTHTAWASACGSAH